MKHTDLKVTNITIKDTPAFRVRLESWESIAPKGLLSVNFIQECLNKDGDIDSSSTYNFHMTRDEIKILCEGLLKV
jgi:hypothetical protein